MTDAATLTAGAVAIIEWSRTIHRDGDRHRWALETAVALDAGREPAPFPARSSSTRASRLETARRLYTEANAREAAAGPRAVCGHCGLDYDLDDQGEPATIDPYTCDDCAGPVEPDLEHDHHHPEGAQPVTATDTATTLDDMAKSDAERAREYRDRKRGAEPRTPAPCGTYAAARRHKARGEELDPACDAALKQYVREAVARSRARKAGATDPSSSSSKPSSKGKA